MKKSEQISNFKESVFDKKVANLLFLVLFSCFLLPSFKVSSSLSLRIDDFIVLIIFPLICLPRLLLKSSFLFVNRYLKLYVLLYFIIIFSCLRGYLILMVPYHSGDINELVRLAKPLFLIMMVSYVDVLTIEKRVKSLIKWGSLFIIIVGIIQYLNVLGLGSLFLRIYGEVHHVDTFLNSDTRRIILTGAGPNDGALIALVLFVFNLVLVLKERKPFNLCLLIGLFACILFTSSRTVLLATVVIVGIALLRQGTLLMKILFSIAAFGIFIYVLPKFVYIYEGFQLAFEGNNNSVLHRFEKWGEATRLFQQSPVFGWGIAKSIHTTIVDGEYFLILRRFGVIGFTLIMVFILFPLFIKNKIDNYFIISVKYIALTSLFVMITNNFFNSYQIITIYVILVSISRKLNK